MSTVGDFSCAGSLVSALRSDPLKLWNEKRNSDNEHNSEMASEIKKIDIIRIKKQFSVDEIACMI